MQVKTDSPRLSTCGKGGRRGGGPRLRPHQQDPSGDGNVNAHFVCQALARGAQLQLESIILACDFIIVIYLPSSLFPLDSVLLSESH